VDMKIYFPGGKKVYADYGEHTIQTDQPVRDGGENTAPAPFDLFLASMGTCAGIYVLGFCQQRDIPTEGLSLTQTLDYNRETKLIEQVNLDITLPKDFPDKYKSAILNVANLCTVKRHLLQPPSIKITTK